MNVWIVISKLSQLLLSQFNYFLGNRFFNDLQKEQFKFQHEVLVEVEFCCQRLWTSALKLNNKGFYAVFQSILVVVINESLLNFLDIKWICY